MTACGPAARFHVRLKGPPACPLRPIIPHNPCPLDTTAATGTQLHGSLWAGTVQTVICSNTVCSSLTTEFYDPKTFLTHAALHRQTSVHCGGFPTAASRRRLGRDSVPVWPITLSGRLRFVALVLFDPTNKLIRPRPRGHQPPRPALR